MADISYTPTVWADGAEGGTPIDAAKLNNIESGIVDAVAAIGPNDTTEDGTLKAQIDANTSAMSHLSDLYVKKITVPASGTATIQMQGQFDSIFVFGQTSFAAVLYFNFSTIISNPQSSISVTRSNNVFTLTNALSTANIELMLFSSVPLVTN